MADLVLAKFLDGYKYRGVCLGNGVIDCKIYFVDYGSELDVDFENIWPMPEKLLKDAVSRTVKVKLKSGKSIKNVDVGGTCDKLESAVNFEAFVEHERDNKFTITIDDSLVVFKN